MALNSAGAGRQVVSEGGISSSNGKYFGTKGNLFTWLLRLRRRVEAISDRMVSSGRLWKIDQVQAESCGRASSSMERSRTF